MMIGRAWAIHVAQGEKHTTSRASERNSSRLLIDSGAGNLTPKTLRSGLGIRNHRSQDEYFPPQGPSSDSILKLRTSSRLLAAKTWMITGRLISRLLRRTSMVARNCFGSLLAPTEFPCR